jgi:hypothetical protein
MKGEGVEIVVSFAIRHSTTAETAPRQNPVDRKLGRIQS